VVVGVLGIAAGAFLPWIVSGDTTRNSFTTVQVARRLGVVDSDLASALLAAWYFVPVAVATAGLLAAVGRPRMTASIAVGVAAVTTGFAVVVLRAPIEPAVGVPFSLGAALGTIAAAVVSLSGARARSSPEPRDGMPGSGGIESADR